MSFGWLDGHACNSYSQFGEDGVLAAIFSVIGATNRWALECGAADGLFFSNARRLIEQGWHAVLVEADREEFARLEENSRPFGDRVRCVHERAGDQRSLDDILAACDAPADIDLAVIDVDGQDFYLLNALHRYRPRVVVIEFDPEADQAFQPTLGGAGQAGAFAIQRLAFGKLYAPVWRSYCNLILVKQPLDRLLGAAAPGTAA